MNRHEGRRRGAAPTLCLLLALIVPGGTAQAWMLAPPADGRIAADLHLAREEITLDERAGGAQSDELRLSRLGIRYAESFGDSVILALSGGYAAARHDTGAALGMRSTGGYAAIDFRGERMLSAQVRLVIDLRLSGYWLRDERGGVDLRHDIIQGGAAAGVQVALRPNLLLHGGPTLTAMRLDTQASGTMNEAREFENRDAAGWRAGAALEVDHGGWIALEGYGGATRGFELSFLRRF